MDPGILKLSNGNIDIPGDAPHMQFLFCVIGHFERGGHRGHERSVSAIKRIAIGRQSKMNLLPSVPHS